MKKKNIGSSLDNWLRAEGIYDEASAAATRRVVLRQLESAMNEMGLSRAGMVRRMRTSRAAVDRLLDPANDALTLNTLKKAAAAVGRQLRLELV